jgi:hypothetical protein
LIKLVKIVNALSTENYRKLKAEIERNYQRAWAD